MNHGVCRKTRWRLKIGLPIPAIFGHTTIELERFDGDTIWRESYGFVGWSASFWANVALFFLIISGVSVPGTWSNHARNILAVAKDWHYVSEDDFRILQRRLNLLVPLIGKYNLYTRNSWQISKRIIGTWVQIMSGNEEKGRAVSL